jgi:hypothetical protein
MTRKTKNNFLPIYQKRAIQGAQGPPPIGVRSGPENWEIEVTQKAPHPRFLIFGNTQFLGL